MAASTSTGAGSDAYRGDQVIATSISMAILQIIVVLLRFYARKIKKVPYAIDDYLIVLALLGSLGQCVVYIIMVQLGGVGYHMSVVQKTPSKLVILEKTLFIDEILDFPFSVTPAKLSLIFFYVRIFDAFGEFRIWAAIVGFVVVGSGVGTLFAAIFQCSPVSYAWDKTIPGGSCFNQIAFYRWVSLPNIVTDVVLMILPLPYLWNMHASTAQKIGVSGIFLLGSLGTIASCIRFSIFFQNNALIDATWTSVELGVWTMAEAGILIIAVCLPSLWPLVKRIIPHCLLSYASAFDSTPKTPSKDRSTFLSKQSTLRRKTSAQSDSVGFTRLGMLPADDWNAATDISAHVHDSENGSQRSESIPMDRITVRKEVHLRTGPSSHLPDSF